MSAIVINIDTALTNVPTIEVGKQGENGATQVVFDVSEMIETYGSGTAYVVVQRRGDVEPYLLDNTVQSGNTVTWTVSNIDTDVYGTGRVQLFWLINEQVAKTVTYQFYVEEALHDPQDAPVVPGGWISDEIGNLDNLTTTAKANLVAAINEVNSKASTNTTAIGTLANLTTTEKSNLVGALNEVNEDVSDVKEDLNLVNDGYYTFDLIPNKYILRDNGTEANYNGWSATDYIEIPSNALVVYYGSANLTWGAIYDKNKTYVSARSWNSQFSTLFNDSNESIYFRTSGSNSDMANTKFKILPAVDKTLTKTGYPADAKTVGDSLDSSEAKIEALEKALGFSGIPSYYKSQLSTKEATIRGHFDNCASNGDGLIFLTDTHFSSDFFTSANPSTTYNANNSLPLVRDVVAKCPIDKIVFGGDLVNTASDVDTMLLCMASFGTKLGDRQPRLRYCVGNHEYYTGSDMGATVKPTPAELYGAGVKYNENIVLAKSEYPSYYFDNSLQKIRYFVVGCDRDTVLSIDEVEWVLSEFLKIPKDYKLVVIGHAFISDNMTGFRGRHAQIMNALDKVKSKSLFNYNGVNYDYSTLDNVEVVCVLTGHTHIDGSLTTSGGVLCICTTTDSYALNYELVSGTPTLSPRTRGTTDEQAFDVFQFDFTNKKIYCTRIGYGSDREFEY